MQAMDVARYNPADPVKPAAAPYSDAEAGAVGHLHQELESLRRLTKRLLWLLLALSVFVVAFFFCFVGVSVHFGHDIHNDDNEEGSSSNGVNSVQILSSPNAPNGYKRIGTLYGGNGYWSQRSTMPQALSDQYIAATQGSVFLAGGTNNNMSYTTAVYEYDVLLNEYRIMPSLPLPLARGGATFEPKQEVLYVVGGLVTDGTVVNDTISTSVYNCTFALNLPAYRTFDPASELNQTSWQKRGCFNEPRSDFCVVTVDGYLYAFGGYTPDFEFAKTVERYNPSTDKWETMSWSLPHGRGDVACTVQESGLVYIAGGVYNTDWNSEPSTWFLNELLEVDVRKGTVKRLSDMPYHRGDLQLTALPNNRLMVTGGENTYYGQRTQVGYHEVTMYDIDDGTWELKPRLYEERFRHAAIYALDAVHVFGGDQACSDATDASCSAYIRDSHIVFWDVDYPEIFVHVADPNIGAVNDTAEDTDIANIAAEVAPAAGR